MSTVITVENLGKKYLLQHQAGKQPYVALRDVLSDGARNLGHKLLGRGTAPTRGAEREEFWALKDVSFEVKQGDRIGIIGRNGAGKSTLLKILSRITEPTTGSVRIKGRVASLLEVGTGFHPELTGRENIYLNGAILGMSRVEIKQKFDEIVDFAEIEKFLDTPVKRYSSGMYVRLAFAVAAHLEPEILVVDEVLAVGDAQFQKKCLGKMEDVSTKEGRTVLFVSHNMGAINKICQRALFLSSGALAVDDTTVHAISCYISSGLEQNGFWQRVTDSKKKDWKVAINSIQLINSEGNVSGNIKSTEPFKISIEFNVANNMYKWVQIAVRVTNGAGVAVFTTASTDFTNTLTQVCKGDHRMTVPIPANFLPPGNYSLIVAAINPGVELYHDVIDEVCFIVVDSGNHATLFKDERIGVVTPLLKWEHQFESLNHSDKGIKN
ncbi:ABC transporter ATP-binding protein [Oryzomonas sagensis]|uniref:ABC transporter ATP-binding protein n=1 Tax=Oryzomonas sagensis TaxID=2603857 RepID=A0ABQ6TM67_9BACT|nr:ABC transporter ATP-binding protein [Oryzomonas sagensis]KAB0669561.1 ABC transporter ATP-binding protein [Oryzomonas sagensis]